MLKSLIIIFMMTIFVLLVYNIFSPLFTDRSSGATQYSKKGKRSKKVRRVEEKAKNTYNKKGNNKLKEKSDSFFKTKQPSMEEAIEQIGGEIGDPIYIRIFKKEAVLEVWMKEAGQYQMIQTYPICAYSGGLGPKLKEGDRQSPEGFYFVTKSRLNPNSRFHLSFNLGYPNLYDRVHGRTGSFLMVHGGCSSVGCYAMTDSKIEEIYELVEQALEHGQKHIGVHIFPFRMSNSNMRNYDDDRWYEFWQNLKEGYDFFERKGIPPNVKVSQKRYTFY